MINEISLVIDAASVVSSEEREAVASNYIDGFRRDRNKFCEIDSLILGKFPSINNNSRFEIVLTH